MPSVAISADFLEAFARVPRAQQRKVRDFITRFQSDPTAASINYEPLHQVRDRRVRSVRIDLAYRAIVLHPERGDVYLLTWVDHHDEAIDWAKDKVFEVNPVTGALQVLDARAIADAPAPPNVHQPAADPTAAFGLFEGFSDADLLRIGMPAPLLPSVRACRETADLDRLQPYLPIEAYEALYWVANLGYSIDQALAETTPLPRPAPVDTDDLAQALQHPDSKRRFVVVRTADELVEMLNAPLEKWRVFLHPMQSQLATADFNGPARVLGGAGTGKTVVAMHRARHLAANIFTRPDDRILVTTFSRTLAHNIQTLLQSLCGPEINRIEVVNLHRWASDFLRAQGIRLEMASRDTSERCWSDAFSMVGTGEWTESFLRSEWLEVVQAQGIVDMTTYLRASRTGRRTPLTRPQRAAVWEILSVYRDNLAALGKREWPDLARETRLFLAGKRTILPYRAVVVDEVQDMHPEELRLIRQIVPEGRNDLFLVGDAHQRIYSRPVTLSSCGIQVRGRSRKLRINYRTTEEIRNWAVALLHDQTIDDLDGGVDDQRGYTSLLHGEAPIVQQFQTLDEECDYLVIRLRELMADIEPEAICLLARIGRLLTQDYVPALQRAGISSLLLEANTPEDAGPGIRLATMHRVKGLEFQHVIIAGVRAGIIPLELSEHESEGSERAEAETQERCLLHVASSRARDTLTITGYGVPSKFMKSSQI